MASRKSQNEMDSLPNPASKFLTWKNTQTVKIVDGEEYKKITGGEFTWSKKNDNEEWENFSIELPFEFAILNSDCSSWKVKDKKKSDKFITTNEMTAYSKNIVARKWDNGVTEVYRFTKEDYKNDETKEQIKKKLNALGVDYHQNVYISPKTKDGYTDIYCLTLTGGALTGGHGKKKGKEIPEEDKFDGWFGFMNQLKYTKSQKLLLSNTVAVNTFKAKINGDIKFMIPVYELGETIPKEESLQLQELFDKLDEYQKADAKRWSPEEIVETAPLEDFLKQ